VGARSVFVVEYATLGKGAGGRIKSLGKKLVEKNGGKMGSGRMKLMGKTNHFYEKSIKEEKKDGETKR